jgi:hypothetical protein
MLFRDVKKVVRALLIATTVVLIGCSVEVSNEPLENLNMPQEGYSLIKLNKDTSSGKAKIWLTRIDSKIIQAEESFVFLESGKHSIKVQGLRDEIIGNSEFDIEFCDKCSYTFSFDVLEKHPLESKIEENTISLPAFVYTAEMKLYKEDSGNLELVKSELIKACDFHIAEICKKLNSDT